MKLINIINNYASEATTPRYHLKADTALLRNNDAYPALSKADALIFTGPTGTNVNDLSCLLIG